MICHLVAKENRILKWNWRLICFEGLKQSWLWNKSQRSFQNAKLNTTVFLFSTKMKSVSNLWRSVFRMEPSKFKLILRFRTAYSTLTSVCEKASKWPRALSLFFGMAGVSRDPQSYATAITACGVVDLWPVAIELMAKMELEGLEKSVITYNSVLNSCAVTGSRFQSFFFSLSLSLFLCCLWLARFEMTIFFLWNTYYNSSNSWDRCSTCFFAPPRSIRSGKSPWCCWRRRFCNPWPMPWPTAGLSLHARKVASGKPPYIFLVPYPLTSRMTTSSTPRSWGHVQKQVNGLEPYSSLQRCSRRCCAWGWCPTPLPSMPGAELGTGEERCSC